MGEVNDKLRIETSGQAQGHRIDGAKAVNDICAEEQRNVQTAPVNGEMLISVRALGANGIEHRAEPACGSQIHRIHMIFGPRIHSRNRARLASGRRRDRGIARVVVLHKLPDFFFEGHLAQQTIHARFDVWIRKLSIRWMCDSARSLR